MLVTDGYNETSGVAGAGLLAGNYYDPYPPRYIANAKELLAQGLPMIVRQHPGVRYPMPDQELFERVDAEGHIVARVGYDHAAGMSILADPWAKKEWGGDYGALCQDREEDDSGLINMNSSCDYSCFGVPLPTKLTVSQQSESTATVRLDVTFKMPHTMTSTVSSIENLTVSIALPNGMELVGEQRQSLGVVTPGETRTVEWTVRETADVDGEIRVAAVGLANGTQPYHFTDVIGGQARLAVRSHQREHSAAAA
ncbi:hypothetical protein V2W30_32110 [Streptomyces sp. Q6]|uniref:Uncharacterized protein n=1 Tax=Streptomyces citrinus TaxID=3118173 RepID=A0ACD5AJU5_9ACTN